MILNYNYFYFVSALSPQLCDTIMEMGLEKMVEAKNEFGDEVLNATTGDWRHKQSEKEGVSPVNDATLEDSALAGKDIDDLYVRDSTVSWINDRWLAEQIWPYVHEANEKAGWNFEWDFTEDLQFTKYDVGQFYGWHADTGPNPYELFDPNIHEIQRHEDGSPILSPHGDFIPVDGNLTDNLNMVEKIRKLSVTISLNDPSEYDGGNLKFDLGPHRPDRYHTCEEIRPRGSIIVFPSHVYHQVTPVTRGTRYSLVAWNLGKPFK